MSVATKMTRPLLRGAIFGGGCSNRRSRRRPPQPNASIDSLPENLFHLDAETKPVVGLNGIAKNVRGNVIIFR